MSDMNSSSNLEEKTYNFYGGFEKSFNEKLSLSLSLAGEYYRLADYTDWSVYPTMQLSYVPSAAHIFQLSFCLSLPTRHILITGIYRIL